MLALAMDEQFVGALSSFPTLVAIHCIVASAQRSNLTDANLFALILHRGHVFLGRLRWCIASIEKAMNVNAPHFAIPRHAKERVSVFLRRMHESVRQQA